MFMSPSEQAAGFVENPAPQFLQNLGGYYLGLHLHTRVNPSLLSPSLGRDYPSAGWKSLRVGLAIPGPCRESCGGIKSEKPSDLLIDFQ